MTDNTRHNDQNEPDFDQFPDEEKSLREIWDKSAKATPEQPSVTTLEVEEALSAVHNQIDGNPADSRTSFNWKWVAAAAVILLIAGAAFLLIPKTVTAPRGEMAKVTLPDGSTVELNSGSQIQYNRLFAFTNRTIQLDGEAFFDVRKEETHFIVVAHNANIEVMGTKFNIRSWSGEPEQSTEVTVTEGAVHFYAAGHPENSVIIRPGNLSTLSAEMEKPTSPEPVSIEQLTGWRNQRLIFNNQSLLVIFQELERRFDTEIRLDDADSAYETLTAYYAKPQELESVLEDICRVKGLHFSKTANGYRVYR